MSIYAPVIVGESEELRRATEDLLCEYPGAIESRLTDLTEQGAQLGVVAMFGMEVEFIFADNPSAERVSLDSDDALYAEIVEEVHGGILADESRFAKGQVVDPNAYPHAVMVNYTKDGKLTCNDDQKMSGIIEVRTGPYGALGTADRYWSVIEAIGKTAANHGRLGVIVSSHLSTSIFDVREGAFAEFTGMQGTSWFVAGMMDNLIHLQPLQMDAGLGEGINVMEAFPHSKDASMTLHPYRAENRHPVVGIVDPRVDTLAALDASVQYAQGIYNERILGRIHDCRRVEFDTKQIRRGMDVALYDLFSSHAIYDADDRRFVMPASRELFTDAGDSLSSFRTMYACLTGRLDADPVADNGKLLREFLADLRLKDDSLQLVKGSPFLGTVSNAYLRGVKISLRDPWFRVVPHVELETAAGLPDRHRSLRHSPIVRRVFGTAAAYLTPTNRAISAKQTLVANSMVELEDRDLAVPNR